MSDNLVHTNDSNFDADVINSEKPALVDFWAEWCGPCRTLGPVIEELAGHYDGKVSVAKVDVDSNQQIAMKFGIRSIPTVMLFNKGELVSSFVGVRPRSDYEQAIDEVLSPAQLD